MKDYLSNISGYKIAVSRLAAPGIGIEKEGEHTIYLSKSDYLKIQNATSSEELKFIAEGIRVIKIKPFTFKQSKPKL